MERLREAGDVLIIHHWDTDGICSASLLYEFLKNSREVDVETPTLGSYHLSSEEITEIANRAYQTVIVADISFPSENVYKLKDETGAEILLFDHHIQSEMTRIRHINPLIWGKSIDECPSTSWIVNDYLKNPMNLLAALGAVGDHGSKFREFTSFGEVERLIEREGLTFEDLLRIVDLIDSNYRTGDREGVETAVLQLLEYKNDPRRILENQAWIEKERSLKAEIERQMRGSAVRLGKVILKEMDTRYNIISTVTRKMAWSEQGRVAVLINRGFFDDRVQVYVRSNGVEAELGKLIEIARKKGYPAGGRDDVMGAVLPKDESDGFIQDVLRYLGV